MATETNNKPGYKTTEFWLTALATIVGLLMASGAMDGFADTHWVTRLIGGVIAVLSALGYDAARAKVKNGQ